MRFGGRNRFVDTIRKNLIRRNGFVRTMVVEDAPTSGWYIEIVRDCFYSPTLDTIFVVVPRC